MNKLNIFTLLISLIILTVACSSKTDEKDMVSNTNDKHGINKAVTVQSSSTEIKTSSEERKEKRIEKRIVKKVERTFKKNPDAFYVAAFESKGFFEKNGSTYTGFYYDIAKKFAEIHGKEIKCIPLNSYFVYEKVNQKSGLNIFNKVDLIIDNMSAMKNRDTKMEYVEFIPVKQIIVYLADSNRKPISTFADLTNEVIIVSKQSPYALNIGLRSKQRNHNYKYYSTDTVTDQIRALENRHGTLTIMDNCVAFYLIEKRKDIQVGSAVSKKQYIGFGVKKGAVELAEKLKTFKKNIFMNDDLGKIWNKYIKDLDYYMYFAEHDKS